MNILDFNEAKKEKDLLEITAKAVEVLNNLIAELEEEEIQENQCHLKLVK